MTPPNGYVAIKGSELEVMQGAKLAAAAPADERFEVTVRVRPRKELPTLEALGKEGSTRHLTHAEYESQYGANPADLAKVEAFAVANGLKVVESSVSRRLLVLSGTVATFSRAFGVKLDHYHYHKGTYRGRTGSVHIPKDLQDVVVGVFGLDNRPIARPHFRRSTAAPGAAAAATFDPPQVARLYNFPTDVTGDGQCIGIVELGGGFLSTDLQTFFGNLGLPVPTVKVVPVDGAANQFTNSGEDVEVALDIQVAGGVAPGARIAVYFAPNDASSKGFLDAVTTAIHDSSNNPSVISISWGGPDEDPSDNFLTQMNEALHAAAMLGVTVCTAAGDNGAADETPRTLDGQPNWDGKVHVDFPSASPFALACGGTSLIGDGAAITSETVWNQGKAVFPPGDLAGSFGATGGGVSTAFELPDYQQNAGVPVSLDGGQTGRGVPDVAGAADPDTGFNIVINGQQQRVGGTSAVAPLWAGLIALINQKKGSRVGFINPRIYALTAGSAFHDITKGNNRVTYQEVQKLGYDAKVGWDPCTGLGSPDGTQLTNAL